LASESALQKILLYNFKLLLATILKATLKRFAFTPSTNQHKTLTIECCVLQFVHYQERKF
jgi:hypothetical protein